MYRPFDVTQTAISSSLDETRMAPSQGFLTRASVSPVNPVPTPVISRTESPTARTCSAPERSRSMARAVVKTGAGPTLDGSGQAAPFRA